MRPRFRDKDEMDADGLKQLCAELKLKTNDKFDVQNTGNYIKDLWKKAEELHGLDKLK